MSNIQTQVKATGPVLNFYYVRAHTFFKLHLQISHALHLCLCVCVCGGVSPPYTVPHAHVQVKGTTCLHSSTMEPLTVTREKFSEPTPR